MILVDRHIRERVQQQNMIEEFSEAVGSPRISYGLTSAGYDVRMGGGILFIRKCKLDTPLSPKGHNNHAYVPTPTEPHVGVVLPPRSYALVYSHEYFRIPRDIKASCTGKSTYARLGLFVNTTPLEPGWEGNITIELANLTDLGICIFPMEGIAQVEFHSLSTVPETDYGQKGGKYQGQKGITPAKL